MTVKKIVAKQQRTTKAAYCVFFLCAVGAGCQLIATVDRSSLGETGGGGGSTAIGTGGIVLGVGGGSGSAGTDPPDDASISDDVSSMGGGGALDDGSIGSGGAVQPDSTVAGAGGIVGTGGGLGSGGTLTDARIADAPVDSPATGSACVRALPAGWTLTAFSPTATSCPASPTGFTDHPVYSGSGTIGATACTCGCTTLTAGTCEGSLSVTIAPGQGVDTCTPTLVSGAAVNGSSCITASAARVESAQATFTGSGSGGTCANTTTPNAAQLTKPTAQHYCDVPAASADAVCNGTAPAGYSSCIMTAAAAATCPTPFTRLAPYYVEDDIALNCGTCAGCTSLTTCPTGTLDMFSDGACANALATVPANGTCVAVGGGGEIAVGSVSYTTTPTSTCTRGTTTPTTTPVTPRTICCR